LWQSQTDGTEQSDIEELAARGVVFERVARALRFHELNGYRLTDRIHGYSSESYGLFDRAERGILM
jgi:hypothetical protein